jgi:hypothetical protein
MTTAFRRRADTGSRGAQKSVPTALSTTTADENLLHVVRTGTDLDQLSFDVSQRGALFGCEDRVKNRPPRTPGAKDRFEAKSAASPTSRHTRD